MDHLSYFETLASVHESSAEWDEVSAGLMTLCVVDAWRADPALAAAGSAMVRDARLATERLAVASPIRARLNSILNTVQCAGQCAGEGWRIASRLVSYACALERQERWALAADVYRTALARCPLARHQPLCDHARHRLAVCEERASVPPHAPGGGTE